MIRSRYAAIAAVMLAAPAHAQKLGHGGVEISPWRVIGALLLCLALGVGGAFALRHRHRAGMFLKQSSARRLQVVESVRVGHQVDVALVRCDGREFLVAASPQGARFGPELTS